MAKPKKQIEALATKASPAEIDVETGKLYLNGRDVWAINTDMGDWAQVHIRDQVFKVRLPNLVIFDNGSEAVNE
jgi:hypothetical protein